MTPARNACPAGEAWDTSSHSQFVEYYAEESVSESAFQRFVAIKEMVLRECGLASGESLTVADIGCGAGTQSMLWAREGHRVMGIDINEPLVKLARSRAEAEGVSATFEIGSATKLPWPDRSVDICLVPELLEHVVQWQECIAEFCRILKPGGLLYLSTTNALCPVQCEFSLPAYSWYPRPLKRYFERLASTTRPELAGYATYPAVNWFTYYSLKEHLAGLGFECKDRFDLAAEAGRSPVSRWGLRLVRAFPPLRLFAHVLTPFTRIVARKHG